MTYCFQRYSSVDFVDFDGKVVLDPLNLTNRLNDEQCGLQVNTHCQILSHTLELV